ncbi:MAG: ATP-dependent DNA ligase [Candidatus Micrarchaeia archaeon]
MLFSEVAESFSEVEATGSRLSMSAIAAKLLGRCVAGEAKPLIYIIEGNVAPAHEGLDAGIGEKFAIRAIAQTSGYRESVVLAEYRKSGDLGSTAEALLAKKSQMSLGSSPNTLLKTYATFVKIAKTSGSGSQEAKISLLSELLNGATPLEAKYLVRFCLGKLRLGIGDPSIIDALSMLRHGDKKDKAELERAFNLCSDLGEVAEFYIAGKPLAHFSAQPFKPIRPALAERLPNAEEIVQKLCFEPVEKERKAEEKEAEEARKAEGKAKPRKGKKSEPAEGKADVPPVLVKPRKCAVEAKYDGLRMQVHLSGGRVEIYSRKLEKMTHMFPEIVLAAKDLKVKSAIFEGEALAYSESEKKYFSFQQTIQRKRKHGIAAMAQDFPLRLFAFDLMYLDGNDMTLEKYSARRRELVKMVKGSKTIVPSEQIITDNPQALDEYFKSLVGAGLEGIIAKDLEQPYVAGARKFAWIKLKKSYGELADTVDTVIVGYYLGKGSRQEWKFGGLLAAVLNEETNEFETIAKIGSGFSEEEMQSFEKMLDEIKMKEKPRGVNSKLVPDFWVQPKYVVTVAADEITLSPMHTAGMVGDTGYALRFPRMMSLREDKGPAEITTTREIIQMFEMQKRKDG